MVNLYNIISGSRKFKKLKADDLLFTEYKCLIKEAKGEVWSHTNYFAFGLKGRKMWRTKNNDYLVEPGQLLFVKKGANTVYQYFDEHFFALIIFVPDEFIKSVIEKYMVNLEARRGKEKIDSVILIRTDDVLNLYFQTLLSYFTKSKPPLKSLMKLKFEELIVSLLTNENNPQIARCFKGIYLNNKTSVKEIMEENFTNNLSLKEFATLTARSLSTFKRDFFNAYGKTPGKWLIEKRLEYSLHLIKNTKKSIEEIIYDSGFSSRSHFIKVFKNKLGTTPLKFRSPKPSLKKVV